MEKKIYGMDMERKKFGSMEYVKIIFHSIACSAKDCTLLFESGLFHSPRRSIPYEYCFYCFSFSCGVAQLLNQFLSDFPTMANPVGSDQTLATVLLKGSLESQTYSSVPHHVKAAVDRKHVEIFMRNIDKLDCLRS